MLVCFSHCLFLTIGLSASLFISLTLTISLSACFFVSLSLSDYIHPASLFLSIFVFVTFDLRAYLFISIPYLALRQSTSVFLTVCFLFHVRLLVSSCQFQRVVQGPLVCLLLMLNMSVCLCLSVSVSAACLFSFLSTSDFSSVCFPISFSVCVSLSFSIVLDCRLLSPGVEVSINE